MSFDMRTVTGAWDYGTLPGNVKLGQGCWIERPQSFERFRSTRSPGLVLGDGVLVYGWSVFNVESRGLVSVGAESVLAGAVFMCAEHVEVGRAVTISYHVTIADCDFHPREPDLRRRDAEASAPAGDPAARPPLQTRPVWIGDEVWIGIGAIILKGVSIGERARIGAGAVVARDVPAGVTVEGNPAQVRQP